MTDLRERKKTALRAAIVRSAVELFTARGYDAVGVEEIAHASMCSRSTFNRYFGNKEDVLFGMAPEITSRFQQDLAAAPSSDKWAAARSAAVSLLTQFFNDMNADIRIDVLRLWHTEPALHRRYLSFMSMWEDMLRQFFADGTPPSTSNRLRAQLLSTAAASALRSALHTALESGEDIECLANQAFNMLESGLAGEAPR